jgi:hypothetical protein
MKPLNRRVRGQRPHQSVFPPAAADNKYSHATAAYSATRAYQRLGSTWGAAGMSRVVRTADWGSSDGRLDAATPASPAQPRGL